MMEDSKQQIVIALQKVRDEREHVRQAEANALLSKEKNGLYKRLRELDHLISKVEQKLTIKD